MEWSKLPTNLITSDLSDAEILAIVKYQLVFSLTEKEPSDKILSKFLTKKQKNIAKNFIADIKSSVENDINSTQKRRNRNKTYYNNNKSLEVFDKENSDVLNVDINPTQIREDKIRVDKTREKERIERKSLFDNFYSKYPKKQDELKAFTVFNFILNEGIADYNDIIKGVEGYTNYIRDAEIETRYITSPYNWLKDRRWNDDYTITNNEKSMFEGLDFNGGLKSG